MAVGSNLRRSGKTERLRAGASQEGLSGQCSGNEQHFQKNTWAESVSVRRSLRFAGERSSWL